jgi:hypothetical protein
MKMTEDIARQIRDRCREFISAEQVADLAAKLDGQLVGDAHQRANQLYREVAARGYVDIQIISQIALLVIWEITRRENERLKSELAEVESRTIEMAWKVECYHIAERYASVLAEREVDSEAMAEKLHALVEERSYEDYDAFPHFDVIYSVAFCQVLYDLGVPGGMVRMDGAQRPGHQRNSRRTRRERS